MESQLPVWHRRAESPTSCRRDQSAGAVQRRCAGASRGQAAQGLTDASLSSFRVRCHAVLPRVGGGNRGDPLSQLKRCALWKQVYKNLGLSATSLLARNKQGRFERGVSLRYQTQLRSSCFSSTLLCTRLTVVAVSEASLDSEHLGSSPISPKP